MSRDYELDDEVYADTPARLKVIADPLRSQILSLVLERAATVTELAQALNRPKSSVAYHVDQLVGVGLLKVVRTRKVRAIDERLYGRVARTIVLSDGAMPMGSLMRSFLPKPNARRSKPTTTDPADTRPLGAEVGPLVCVWALAS